MPLPDPGPDPLTNSDAWVIEAEGLSKRFEIYLNDRSRFFEFFGRRRHHEEHWALRDLSFKVRRGRSFGVIGANGAEEVIEIALDAEAKANFDVSVNEVRGLLTACKGIEPSLG